MHAHLAFFLVFVFLLSPAVAPKTNKNGRSYTPGVTDEGLFHHISWLWRTHPDLTPQDVQQRTGAALSSVYRVHRRLLQGILPSPPQGRVDRLWTHTAMQRYTTALFASFGPRGGYISLRDLAQHLGDLVLRRVHLSEVSHLLVHELRLRDRQALYEHPNKWNGDNREYYGRFLRWRAVLDPSVHVRFIFFDEVRVDRSHLGRIRLRGHRNQRPTVIHDYHRQGGESWTVNFMTNLLTDPPFFFTIVPGSSNSHRYVSFWVQAARLRLLRRGQCALVDNMNFHVIGWSADVVRTVLREYGVAYKALPKYSPELNPAELVFSALKRCLLDAKPEDSLVQWIFICLRKITKQSIIRYYLRRGYLQ